MRRYLEKQILQDLQRKMVFVGGPRQVGKTTLARQLLGKSAGYMNWDVAEDREAILKREWPDSTLWVFDEIHKYRGWRNYLKGIYDRAQRREKILVTGSARLDLYRFGGDSLQGRYHFLRLHPLSVAELGIKSQADFEQLLHLGGFPEPFLGGSQLEARRWAREYRTRLIREDLAGVEMIQDLGNLELLMLRLPDLVGSPLSQNALSGDLGVSPKTVGRWLDAFERLYAIFRLPPLGSPKLRAIRKSQKHYHLDWTLIAEPGPRFENMVAGHLLKWVHFLEDSEGRDVELRYFRDVDGREVDFIILENRKPWMAIECKLGDGEISRGVHYFHDRFPECQTFQIAAQGKKQYRSPEGIRVMPAMKFLQTLV